jgi:hypothetical protein
MLPLNNHPRVNSSGVNLPGKQDERWSRFSLPEGSNRLERSLDFLKPSFVTVRNEMNI